MMLIFLFVFILMMFYFLTRKVHSAANPDFIRV